MTRNSSSSSVDRKEEVSKFFDLFGKGRKDKGEEMNPLLPVSDAEEDPIDAEEKEPLEPLESGDVVYTVSDIGEERNQEELIYYSETRFSTLEGNTYGVVLSPKPGDTVVRFRDFEVGENYCVSMPERLLRKGRRFHAGDSVVIGENFPLHPSEWEISEIVEYNDEGGGEMKPGPAEILPGHVGHVLCPSRQTVLGFFVPSPSGGRDVEVIARFNPLLLRWDVSSDVAKNIEGDTGNDETKMSQNAKLRELRKNDTVI